MLRLLLASVGLAIVWVLASWVMASDSASADENDGLLGSALSGVVSVVEAPLGAVTHSTGSAVSTVVGTVTDVAPAPVDRVISVVPKAVGTVDAVVQAKPVAAIVAPIAQIVDPVVAAVPVVSTLVGSTPVADIVAPVANLVDDSLGNVVVTRAVALPLPDATVSLPDVVAPTVANDPATRVTAEADVEAEAVAPARAEAVPFSATNWATSLSTTATTLGSVVLAETTPGAAPQLPLGDSTLPVAPSASGSVTSSGGPAGAGLVATLAGTETAAPLSGSLFSRAGDDIIPSSPARNHDSSPD